MKVFILTNALDYGDAVSTHCILLKQRCIELGVPASIHAEFAHALVKEHNSPLEDLRKAGPEDVLFHQFFNETGLLSWVEQFPGYRVMMYHNITPPNFFEAGGEVEQSCDEGLRQAASISYLYDLALGMSAFSRADLDRLGYAHTGVFSLLVDTSRLTSIAPNPIVLTQPVPARPIFLAVGRIAPNKRIEHLLEFLAAYRAHAGSGFLQLVGNDNQHPAYRDLLHQRARELELRPNRDFAFTGKIPEDHLIAHYHRAGAYICLSDHEGFCAPLIEAMAFNLPVITHAAGAIEETMGGAGLLFSEKDFVAMAATVRQVLEDRTRRDALLAGQQSRLQAFTPEAQQSSVRRLLDDVRALQPTRPSFESQPSISVVINTFNRGPQLERCLRALRRQTYPNFEIVVVNGPSTDNTTEVLRRFEGKIRVVSTQSRVLSVSRNEGIAAARGELIAFTDDDALPQPDWLTHLAPAFDDPATGGAGGLVYRMNNRSIEFRNGIIDKQGAVKWDQPRPGKHWNWEGGYLNTVSGNNCIFRRSALEKIGGFDERIEYYHDEADVVLRLRLAGYRTVHRPSAVVYHEAARGHNRSNPYVLNWFAIMKNTLYVALKTQPRGERRALGWRITRQLIDERLKPIAGWRRNGWITRGEYLKMEWGALRGIATGFWRGMYASPHLRTLTPVASSDSILRYETTTEDPFRVCILTQGLPSTGGGGIATYSMSLARALRDAGATVHIVSRGERYESRLQEGIWFHTTFPMPAPVAVEADFGVTRKNLEYAEGVRKTVLGLAAKWGLDLTESPSWDAEGVLLAMDRLLPVVTRVHSPLFKVMESQQWEQNDDLRLAVELEGLLLRRSCGVIGSTRAILDLFDRRYGLPLNRTTRIPLGLEDMPPPTAQNGPPEKRILFVGRLERRKGIHVLLEAMPAVLAQSDSDVVFDIVGPDSVADPITQQTWTEQWRTNHPQWNGRVRFHGEVLDDQLNRLYASCDLFVAPSLYESFGLIYLEAMAHGKAVVGTRIGGIPEVVADSETGLLTPPDDPRALAVAMLRLINDPQETQRMGTAGHRRFKEHFSSAIMAKRQLAFYRERAEEWNRRQDLVWRGPAVDLDRHAETRIDWSPETGENSVAGLPGHRGKLAFGPRMPLGTGTYRVECDMWLGAPEPDEGWYGNLEADSEHGGVLAKQDFLPGSFPHHMPAMISIFFTIAPGESHNVQARVHTEGKVPLHVREIRLRRWAADREAAS